MIGHHAIKTAVLVLSLAIYCGGRSLAQANQPLPPPPDRDVLVLPKYEIPAERIVPPMKKWKYVSVPGYEILSDTSERNTRRFVEDFHRFRQVVEILLPAANTNTSLPAYIVLCSKGNDFDHFLPKNHGKQATNAGSLFLSDKERSAIVVDFMSGSVSGEAYRNFYVQYLRYLIRSTIKPSPPRWLEEGLVQVYAMVDFTDNRITLGKVDPPTSTVIDNGYSGGGTGYRPRTTYAQGISSPYGYSSVNYYNYSPGYNYGNAAGFGRRSISIPSANSMALNAIMPLVDFFRYHKMTPQEQKNIIGSYIKQAQVFTHMCLFGRNHRYQKGFFRIAEIADHGPITEEVFKECFGINFKKMEIELRGYSQFTDYHQVGFKLKNGKLEAAPTIDLREASDAESGRIAGETMRLAGNQTEALDRLIAPYVRGFRDADLLAALGLAEQDAGHTQRARKFLETAVQAKTTRSRAYVELTQLRSLETNSKAQAEKRPLSPNEIAYVQDPLLAGLRCPPPMLELYDRLARLWYSNKVSPSEQDFKILATAPTLYPNQLGLIYRIAAIGVNCGNAEKSRSLISHGLEMAPNEEMRKLFRELQAKLPPVPKILEVEKK